MNDIIIYKVERKVKKLANSSSYIRGTAYWAKVTGPARKNNFDDYKEWTIDVSPDPEGLKLFKQLGIQDRLKDPKAGDKRETRYITFRQKELRADGTPNGPIRIVDAAGKPWDDDVLIGNGSTVDVKFNVKDYGKGKKKGVYIAAIRVLDLVTYESGDFKPLDSDDEFFASAAAVEAKAERPSFRTVGDILDDDLDDVI